MSEPSPALMAEENLALSVAEPDTLGPPVTVELKRRSFGGNVLLTTGTNVAMAVMALISGPLCARLLGPSGRGELAALQNLYWLVGVLALLGLPEATLFFTAREPHAGGRILASSCLLALMSTPLFYFAARPALHILLGSQRRELVQFAPYYLGGIPLLATMVIPVFALRGQSDFASWNFLRCLPSAGWLLALILAFLLVKPSPQVLAVSYLLVLTVLIVPTVVVVRRRIPGPYLPDVSRWKAMIKYGAPLSLASIPQLLNLRLDQLMMAAILPSRELGLYVAAVAWSTAVQPVLVAIGTVSFPRIAGAACESERNRWLLQGTRLAVLAAVVLVIGLVAITPLAIPLLFGNLFRPAVPPGIVLAFASTVAGLNVVFEEVLRGLGDSIGVFLGEAGGLLITVAGLILWLKKYSLMGASVAAVLGYSAAAVVLLIRLRGQSGLSFTEILLPTVSDLHTLRIRISLAFVSLKDRAGALRI